MSAKREHEYLIEQARTSRAHCGRQRCEASNVHGDYIQKGCVVVQAVDPDTNNQRFFHLQEGCTSPQQTENMHNFYGDFKDVPGVHALPEELQGAAIQVLQAIKDASNKLLNDLNYYRTAAVCLPPALQQVGTQGSSLAFAERDQFSDQLDCKRHFEQRTIAF